MSTRFSLRIVGGAGSAEQTLPERGDVVIGRSRECDVAVNDGGISRRHVILHISEQLLLEDLGSANGTRLVVPDGARAADGDTAGTEQLSARKLDPGQTIAIRPGDVFQLGATLFVVSDVAETDTGDGIVVSDDKMREVYALAQQVAPAQISVLLLGETGTGKEVLAEHIVRCSDRASAPFLRLNCAAFSETMLEAELFGYERGAFTGAVKAKPGLLESAQGGTVFLDEIGEISAAMQVKLLRALESRQAMRIGALEPRAIDARFISATNRDLRREVELGTFRGDLFFRLNGITIAIPPLRERPGEITALARAFVERSARALKRPAPSLDEHTLYALQRYRWPGNIRELRNVMERAVLLSGAGPIAPAHLPPELSTDSPASAQPRARELHQELGALERDRILEALEACNGNQTRAAKLLGISRTTFVARLEEYGVPRPRK